MIQAKVRVYMSFPKGGWYEAGSRLERDLPYDVLEMSRDFLLERVNSYAPVGRYSGGYLKNSLNATIIGRTSVNITSDASYFLAQEKGYTAHVIPIEYLFMPSPGTWVDNPSGFITVPSNYSPGEKVAGKGFVKKAVDDLRNEIKFKTLAIIKRHLREALS